AGVAAAGSARAAVEQRVTAEQYAQVFCVEAGGTRRVPRGVQGGERSTGDGEGVAFADFCVHVALRVDSFPKHAVFRVQEQRSVYGICDVSGSTNVVIVSMGEQHGHPFAFTDSLADLGNIVGRVDHHDLGVIADDPDIVIDIARAAIQREGAGGDDVFNAGGH